MPNPAAQQALEAGLAHHHAGRVQRAEAHYRQVLALEPSHPDALHLLGVIAHQVGRNDVAADLMGRAIAANPNVASFHNNLGEALRALGRADQAVACYQRCLQLDPKFAGAYNNLGEVCREREQLEEAIGHYRKAIQYDPAAPEPHNNMGIAVQDLGRPDEAMGHYRRALELRPDYPHAHSNIGTAYRDVGQIERAMECFQRAIELDPRHPDGHFARAFVWLLTGDMARGWAEYEWRWLSPKFPSPRRNFAQPLWKGEDIAGRTILLHAEQGFGDGIQFVRYVPMVAARGARVVLECQKELMSLFHCVPGVDHLVWRGGRLPPFDVHAPLLSLPLAFGTTLQTVPAQVPYLHAEPARAAHWREAFRADQSAMKVGLVWAGRSFPRDRLIPLKAYAPLAGLANVTFYSLQKGDAAKEAAHPPAGMKLVDLDAQIQDFADTAAIVANLDLVISIDTAVAHLAGAMAQTRVAAPALRTGLAVAAAARGHALVSDDAAIPPRHARRMDWGNRAHAR